MEYVILFVSVFAITLFLLFLFLGKKSKKRYDRRGFDHNHIHRNGTKFDDDGYDYFGYDANGYNKDGYNTSGRNSKNQYNRFFDTQACERDGFYSPQWHPVIITPHAEGRIEKRLGIKDKYKLKRQAMDAYRYGKSKHQIKKSSTCFIEEIEQKHENSVILIYKGFIYVFSRENVLITVYKNEKIPL